MQYLAPARIGIHIVIISELHTHTNLLNFTGRIGKKKTKITKLDKFKFNQEQISGEMA